jgi:hypothetical protein
MARLVVLLLLAPSSVEVHLSRTFGYWTGDLVPVEVRVRVPPGWELVPEGLASIPAPEWLELRSMRWKRRGSTYHVHLTYQVFYVPSQVTVVEIPSWTLRFRSPSGGMEVPVPSIPITLSPLTHGSDPAVPDRLPPPPSPLRLYVHGGLLTLLIGVAGVLWGIRRLRRPQVLRRAYRRICTLDHPAGALDTLWEALERKARSPLFPHTLETLIRRWPPAGELQEELRWLFALRETWCYRGGDPPDETLRRLRDLARRLARLEGKRWS